MPIEWKTSYEHDIRDQAVDIRRQAQEWADDRVRERTQAIKLVCERAEAEAKMTVELAKAQVAALVTELAQTKCDLELARQACETNAQLLIEYDRRAMLRTTINTEPGKSPGTTGD